MTETELATACANRDPSAMESFLAQFTPLIRSAVASETCNDRRWELDPEDITQDVIVKLFRQDGMLLRRFDPQRASLSTYLHTIAISTTRDAIRHVQRSAFS